MGVKKTRLENEADNFLCAKCGCGFEPDEPRNRQFMDGPGIAVAVFWHESHAHCVRALLERVHELEKVVARQAMQLGEKRP